MKKLILSLAGISLCLLLLIAQTPVAFKYQAVARDNSGEVMADKTMSIRLTIMKGLALVYSEVHSVTTNEFGLFSVEIGRGNPESGSMQNIDWSDDTYFLRVEADPNGGSNFSVIGTSELLSVPYAMHAETVTQNDDADADSENEIQDLKITGSVLQITKNANPTLVDLAQYDDQELIYDNDNHMLHLDDGGSVNLSNLKNDADSDPANELQVLSQNGSIVTLSHGGGAFDVSDADANPFNEIQSLSQSGNTITLSHSGGSVTFVENDGDYWNEIQDLEMQGNFLFINKIPNPTMIDMNPYMDNTDDQTISYDLQTGNLSLEDGGVVNIMSLKDDADADSTNELQTMTRSGNNLTLSHGGGTVSIADNDNDPVNEIQTLSRIGNYVVLSKSGGYVYIADDDSSSTNEIQDLTLIGDTLMITDNANATMIDLGTRDNQTLNFSNSTYEMTIWNGNTVDLTALKDDADADSFNEIQDLYKQGDSLVISNNPWATIIDLSGYMDNTDTQALSLSGTDLIISGGNTVDLSSFMDDTDDQALSLSGTDLSITDANTVDLSGFMDNTDTQTLSWTNDSIFISNGNGIDLSSYLDNTDGQTLNLALDSLSISGGNSVDLSSYLDNTDAQTLLLSNDTLSISSGNNVVLSSYMQNSEAAGGDLSGTFPNPQIAANAVTTSEILDGTLTEDDLANGAVTTAKIYDFNVTNAKLGNSSVTTPKIMDGNVTSTKLASNLIFSGTTTISGNVDFGGAIHASSASITADYTAAGEFIILADASSGNITVTLPPAASAAGRMYIIKRMDGSVNTIAIDADGAEQIDGTATQPLIAQYDFTKVYCDGSQWLIIGQ